MILRVCPVPGCPELVARGQCAKHARLSPRNHYGIARQARGHGREYERVRAMFQGEPCALRLPGCTNVATSADYAVPGDWASPLRPACQHCQRAQGARLSRIHTTGEPA